MRSLFALLSIIGVVGLGALASSAVADVIAKSESRSPAIASLSDVTRIRAGDINCRHCDLSGADLSNQCVKNGDLTGANFDRVTARYMCMSLANFTDATFRNADLTGANLGQSVLKNADMTGAKLNIASIKGADLSTAKGLIQAQIDLACGDAKTKLPPGLHVKSCS